MEGLFSGVPELMRPGVSEDGIYSLVPLIISWLDISHNEVPSLDSFTDLHSGLISYLDHLEDHLEVPAAAACSGSRTPTARQSWPTARTSLTSS